MISLFDLVAATCNPYDSLLIYIAELSTIYTLEEFIIDFQIKDLARLKLVYVDLLCVNGDAIQCSGHYDQLLECFGEELRKR